MDHITSYTIERLRVLADLLEAGDLEVYECSQNSQMGEKDGAPMRTGHRVVTLRLIDRADRDLYEAGADPDTAAQSAAPPPATGERP